MPYSKIETTNTITHIPDGVEGEISVLIFYPGIDVSGKQGRIYMPPLIEKGAPDWFDKYIIVIPNRHKTKWNDVKKDYESEMDSRNLKTKNLSLGVFSGSGQNGVDIQNQIPSLGLINFMIMDPSPGSSLKKSVTSVRDGGGSVYMMYNPGNWTGDLKHLGEAQPEVANLVGTANAIRNKDSHMVIPTNFLKTFKDKIESTLSSKLKNNDNISSPTPTTKQKREKIDSTFTFNVEKENIFVIVSTGTFSTSTGTASGTTASSGIASEIGELMIVDDSELFVFQDESEEFILDEEFQESEFSGFEETSEFESQEYESEEQRIETENQSNIINSEPYVPGKHKLDLLPGVYKGNGGIELQLCQIHGKPVNIKIAEELLDMIEAAKADGVNIRVSSGFRPAFYPNLDAKSESGVKVTSQSQEELYNQNCKGGKCTPATAKAGYSKHGNGIAIDISTGSRLGPKFKPLKEDIYKWMVRNSWKYGFVRTVPSEEWHYEYWPESKTKGPYTKLSKSNERYYADLGLNNLQIT